MAMLVSGRVYQDYNPKITSISWLDDRPLKISMNPKVMEVDGSDDFPFQFWVTFSFQPFIFQVFL